MNNMDKITFLLLQLSCLLFFVGIITTVPVTNVVDGELENLFEGRPNYLLLTFVLIGNFTHFD